MKKLQTRLAVAALGLTALAGAGSAQAATVSYAKSASGVDIAVSPTVFTYTGTSTSRQLKVYTGGTAVWSQSAGGSTVASGTATFVLTVNFLKSGATWSATTGSVSLTDPTKPNLKLASSSVLAGLEIGDDYISFAFTQGAGFAIPAGMLVIPSVSISAFSPATLVTSAKLVGGVDLAQGATASVPLPAAATSAAALIGQVALRRRRR